MVLPKNRAVSRYLKHFLVDFSRVIDMKAIKRILILLSVLMVSANSLAMDNIAEKEIMNKKIIVEGNNKFGDYKARKEICFSHPIASQQL